jgi:hypothetical protein
MVANPATAIDQLTTNYHGVMKFGQSRSILFQRYGTNNYQDKYGLYMSWVDKVSLVDFTNVPSEAVGVSGSTHYTHTMTAITGVKTAHQVTVSATVAAGTETFNDDKNGGLLSNFGGTGTVNYSTGAIDVTFSDTTTGAVTCGYYWEDASSHGVCDFSIATTGSPAIRTPGSGRYFSQFDGGGPLNAVFPLSNVFYGFHTLKTFQTTIPSDDADVTGSIATNLPFREKMGVSNPQSAFGGAQGIYFINNSNPNRPEVYQLSLFTGGTSANVASPTLISKALNLSVYDFSYAVIFEWGIYVLLSCAQVRNGAVDTFNSRTFIYNKKSGAWDLTDYPATRLAEYMGTLLSGDPFSNNLYTLFSGFDDIGELISNYWTSGYTNHGFMGQKRTRNMVIDGLIQSSQQVQVSVSYDGGAFVNVFTIDGAGSYVDTGKTIAVGSYTIGSKTVGGGATVYANPFHVEFPLNSPRYEYVRVKFEAIGGGYIQLNYYTWKTVCQKSIRSMPDRVSA